MSDEKKFILAVTLPMLWGDMDAQGHLNNVQYFRYFEQARAEWLIKIGAPLLPEGDLMLLVVTADCTYLRPINYPANITVKTYLGGLGHSSFMVYYELYVNGDETICYATGSSKIVCFDPRAKKSVEVPENFKQYF